MAAALITPRSAARVAGMVRTAPERDLADVVELHWVVRWDRRGLPALRHEILPDPSVNLTVETAGRRLYGPGSGSGRSLHELSDKGIVVGTKFWPGGFSGFWPGPVSQLTGRVLTLADAFGLDGERFDADLAAAPDLDAILLVVNAFLRKRRSPRDLKRALAMDIIEAMRSAPPGAQVADLAADFAISSRTLQRLFACHVGISPKDVLQRFRRQQAADRLLDPTAPELARLAAELGYYDQAHMARDLRTTLDRIPSTMAASANDPLPHDGSED